MFSQTVEYALRAMVLLADGAPHTTQQIAAAGRVPPDYLAKVLQSLARAGLVRAQRGKKGGFRLARFAGEISILTVVNVVDPIRRIHECPLGLEAHGTRLCALHRKIDDALDVIERSFGSTMLADLLEGPQASRPLCARASGDSLHHVA